MSLMRFALSFLLFLPMMASAYSISMAERLRQAMHEYESSRYDAVVALLNPYSEELNNSSLMLLASAYSRQTKYGDEVRVLRTLVSKNESSFEAQMLLGQALLKQMTFSKGHEEEGKKKLGVQAIQAFRQCLKLNRGYRPAFEALLNALIDQHAPSDARELLTEGIEKFGHTAELMTELCRLDSSDGFVSQALKSCDEAIHLAPNHPDSYVYQAQSLFDGGDSQQAEHKLVTAAHRFPASEFVQWAAGTVFMKKKNYPVSARFFGEAVKADPNSSRAEFGYAQALYESGQESKALPFWAKACRLDPVTVTELFFTAGSKLRARGQDALAESYKETAFGCHSDRQPAFSGHP